MHQGMAWLGLYLKWPQDRSSVGREGAGASNCSDLDLFSLCWLQIFVCEIYLSWELPIWTVRDFIFFNAISANLLTYRHGIVLSVCHLRGGGTHWTSRCYQEYVYFWKWSVNTPHETIGLPLLAQWCFRTHLFNYFKKLHMFIQYLSWCSYYT